MLLKVVIVDDEWIIRRSIAATVQSIVTGCFEVVGMASNGVEGTEIIRSLRPDIVITDVKMPRMNGIEMVRCLKKEGISFSSLFISGFGEFEYVKQALDLKAEKYLLKPIDAGELEKILGQLAEQKQQEAVLYAQMEHAAKVMREATLSKLLMGGQSFGHIAEEEEKWLAEQLPGKEFCVALFLPDDIPAEPYGLRRMEPYLRKYAVYNVTQEMFAPSGGVLYYYSEKPWFAVLLGMYPEKEDIEQLCDSFQKITDEVKEHLPVVVTVGVGDVCDDLKSCSKSFSQASEALEFRSVYGKGSIISWRDMPKADSEDVDFDFGYYQKMLSYTVKMNEREKAEMLLLEIRRFLEEHPEKTLAHSKAILTSLLAMVVKDISEWQADAEILQKRFSLAAHSIQMLETQQEIYERFRMEFFTLKEIANGFIDNQQKRLTTQAKEYINEHYMDRKLSLQMVAAQVHVSPSYLSVLFKRESGENFIDFITALRMEKARELLCTTNCKTSEIARQVGYANAQYFSICFKKFYGRSPNQFKKRSLDTGE